MSGADRIKCSYCVCTFTSKKNMYRHIRKFHKTVSLQLGKLICPLCKKASLTLNAFQSHFKSDDHPEVQLVYHEETFYCEDDFLKWKMSIERDSRSFFVKRHGYSTLSDGRQHLQYSCNRSGIYEPKKDRIRRLKNSGYLKTGVSCPASIDVIKDSMDEALEMSVTYQSVHVGHANDFEIMLLKQHKCSYCECSYTKQKNLVRHIRSSHKTLDISGDYNIDKEVIFNKDDAISVDLIVNSMQSADENSILIYKPVEELLHGYPNISKGEFLLSFMNSAQQKFLELYGSDILMIDSMHGTNKHGFQLTTLMVADCKQEGFPVAVLYSTQVSEETFIPFFEAIKYRVPDLKPRVFMSDDVPALYNAFKRVFGDVEHYLLCSWHVKRAWNTNLASKIKDRDIRADVKRKILDMLNEKDFSTFTKKVEEIISELLSGDNTKHFGEYLCSHYINRAQLWAQCYRVDLQINTNMKVKRWHRDTKCEKAGGRIIKRLDKSLSIVLSAIAKRLIEHIVSLEPSDLTLTIAEIRKRHDEGKLFSAESVIESKQNFKWVVYSSTASCSSRLLETYDVSFVKTCACKIRCDECDICIHSFTCTCPDYSTCFVICKHIHLVSQNFSKTKSDDYVPSSFDNDDHFIVEDSDEEIEEQLNDEHVVIVKEINKASLCKSSDLDCRRSTVISELRSLQQGLQSLIKDCEKLQNPETLKVVEDGIHLIKINLHSISDNISTLPMVSDVVKYKPANKNKDVQRKYTVSESLKRKWKD